MWWLLACTGQQIEETKGAKIAWNKREKIVDLGSTNWNYPPSTLIPVYTDRNELFTKAKQSFARKEYTTTFEILLEILKEDPEHFGAHSLLSSTFIHLDDLTQAEKAARQVILLNPSALAYCNLATVLLAASRREEAQANFERALEIDPKSFLAVRNLASLTYRGGELEAARSHFEHAIRLNPSDSYLYISLGQVLVELGHLQEAEAVYRFRIQELAHMLFQAKNEAGGASLDLPLALGEVLRRQGRWNEAVDWFEKSLEWVELYDTSWTFPEIYIIEANLRLAKTYVQVGQMEAAHQHLAVAEEVFAQSRTKYNTSEHLDPLVFEQQKKDVFREN